MTTTAKLGLPRSSRKAINKVTNLKAKLKELNKRALKDGFSTVKVEFDTTKIELRIAKANVEKLELAS